METFERAVDEYGPGQLWVGSFAAVLLVAVGAVMAAPQAVWDRFLWQYFWGPVYADAKAASCAEMTASGPQPLYDGCRAAIQEGRSSPSRDTLSSPRSATC